MTLDQFVSLIAETLELPTPDVFARLSESGLDSIGLMEVMAIAVECGATRSMPEDLELQYVTLADIFHYMFE